MSPTPRRPPKVLIPNMKDSTFKPLATATAQSTNKTSDTVATANMVKTNASKSRIESLPAEVRLLIWKLALPTGEEVEVTACDNHETQCQWCYYKKDEATIAASLAKMTPSFNPHPLVLVTKEIRNEILPFIDHRRVFVFSSPCCISSFFRRCSIKRKGLVKEICLKWDIPTPIEAQTYSSQYSHGWVDETIKRALTRRFHEVDRVRYRLTELEANGHFTAIHEVKVGKPIEERREDESESEESE